MFMVPKSSRAFFMNCVLQLAKWAASVNLFMVVYREEWNEPLALFRYSHMGTAVEKELLIFIFFLSF